MLHSDRSFRHPVLVGGVLLVPNSQPTRGGLDVILESKGRGDDGVKLFVELK